MAPYGLPSFSTNATIESGTHGRASGLLPRSLPASPLLRGRDPGNGPEAATNAEIEYPSDDGKPVAQTGLHVRDLQGAFQVLDDHFAGQPNVFVGANLFLYNVKGNRRHRWSCRCSPRGACRSCPTVCAADLDNPLGYFEYEPVMHLYANADWIHCARGRAIKVVAPLLRYLPGDQDYGIIFIERNVDEILDSQLRMLAWRRQKVADSLERRARLKAAFIRQVHNLNRTLCQRPRTRVHFLNHADVFRDPRAASEAIACFLGTPLDMAAMAAQVQPALHRQRSDTQPSTSSRRDSP